jgi:transposase InsO family protein
MVTRALHLEGMRSRCSQMVQGLSRLPEREDNQAARRRCAANSSPSPPVFTVDLVGLLPTSPDGFKYIFTVIDRSTRWLEAILVKNLEATTAVDALVEGWISRFAVPADITTDRGTQFTSQVWAKLCNRLGVKHHMTTAYHPASNGLVERAHRQLKDSLRACLAGNDWPAYLPWILLGLRAAPKEDSRVSSAELVLGSPLTLPGEFLHGEEPPAENFLQYMKDFPPPASTYGTSSRK